MAVGTVGAILGGAALGTAGSIYAANKGAKAAGRAADAQAQAQMEQLAYLKEVERIPQHFREQALNQLGALYGLSPVPEGPSTPQAPLTGFEGLPGTGGGFIGSAMRKIASQAQPGQPVQAEEAVSAPQPLSRGEFVQGLLDDPFYEMMLERGEEGVLRNAAVTGGLRSGNVQDAL